MDWAIDRLQELRKEYAAGENQLAELDLHRERVRAQLHRIEGAISVLEEQLAAEPAFASSSVPEPVARG